MASSETFVIVGGGLAGGKTAQALRKGDFDGRIVLLGAEPHRPYERPPLSKKYLMGTAEPDSIFVHPADWYTEHRVELRLGCSVTGLNRAAHLVEVDDGEPLGYDKLLLATGARSRRLQVPGADADGVYHLRTVEDSDGLRRMFADASRMVVIGAGWIGLEVTAAARAAGVEVTIVETASLPLLRVLGEEAATVFEQLHRDHGVEFRFDATVTDIRTEGGAVSGVALGSGEVLPADAVLVAVGAIPNTELAIAAGLEVDNGVLTDPSLRTSDPDIFAAGDVANALHPMYGHRVRVEHWENARKQPVVAAAGMLGATDASYAELPYFYTDQYDLGMEYVGYVQPAGTNSGYDQVVFRGDITGREFVAFWLKQGRLLAGMAVNVWDMVDPIKALIGSRASLDTSRLADPTVALEVGALTR